MSIKNHLTRFFGNSVLPTARSLKTRSIPALETSTAAIGRSAAGKTTFYTAVNTLAADQHLPSGLHFSSGNGNDPLAVVRSLNETRARRADLKVTGLPSTLEGKPGSYNLFEGVERRVNFTLWECVGQVLSSPDENPRIREKYEQYVRTLRTTDCLWVFCPLPQANMSGAAAEQFDYDVKLANAYLAAAAGLERASGHTCSVALVLTKIDGTFQTENEARQQLSDELLKSALGPLVNTCLQNQNIESAIIVPTSSMGFGQTQVLQGGGRPRPHDEDLSVAEVLNDEPTWVLKNDAAMLPFNVTGLLHWTILRGILSKHVNTTNGQSQALTRVVKKLRQDLADSEPWFVHLKGN